jgi:hypothetical protein
MKHSLYVLLGMSLLFAGCLPLSVHPLYSDSTVVREPRIVGHWSPVDSNDGDIWQFSQNADSSYRLVVSEPDKPDGIFVATVAELGGGKYLDVFPEEPQSGNDFYDLHLIPAHSFYQMRITGDSLSLAYIDPTWFDEETSKGNVTIAHETRKDLIVLTAPTEDLQKFVVEYANKAFDQDHLLVFARSR